MAVREADLVPALIMDRFGNTRPRYLDFACGTGRITSLITPLASHAVGVDVSESMLDIARRKCPAAEFITADLTRTQVRLAPFDLVTAFRFVGNAQDTLRSSALRAINRLLKPGGIFLLNNHRNPNCLAARLGTLSGGRHDMDLTHSKLKRHLRESGFEIIRSYPMGVWLFRYRLMASADPRSPASHFWERVLRNPALSAIAPNSLILARKTEKKNTRRSD